MDDRDLRDTDPDLPRHRRASEQPPSSPSGETWRGLVVAVVAALLGVRMLFAAVGDERSVCFVAETMGVDLTMCMETEPGND